jgi:hypothetical protein
MAIEQSIQVKLAGDVVGKRGSLVVIRTIGIDSKNKPHEDMHKVQIASDSKLGDINAGMFLQLEGTILDGEMDQVIDANVASVKVGDGKYKNLVKIIGEVKEQPQFFPRTADNKPPMMNLRVVACGQKTFATLFGPLAQDFKVKCPITSVVQVYGRMRRKEIVNQDGGVRKWIDVATDDFYFPGLTKVLKTGTGAVDEFAAESTPKQAAPMDAIEVMMFTPKAAEKPAGGKKRKVA